MRISMRSWVLVAWMAISLSSVEPIWANDICTAFFTSRASEWNEKIGNLWARVLSPQVTPNFLSGTVLEIAPGDVPKIGIGLAKLGFHGTIYVIEPELQSAKKIESRYKMLMPLAKVIVIRKTLAQALRYLPRKKIDGIFANHPLDDMIIGEFLKGREFQRFFRDHYKSPADATLEMWNKIEGSGKISATISSVVNAWIKLLQKTNPKFLVISQYESFFFQRHGIKAPDSYAFTALQQLQALAVKSDYSKVGIQDSEIQDPQRWLMLEKNSN